MPMFIEFDKTDGKISRIFSAGDRPPDAAHLSYQVIPEGMPMIDLSLPMPEVTALIQSYLDGASPVVAAASVSESPEGSVKFQEV